MTEAGSPDAQGAHRFCADSREYVSGASVRRRSGHMSGRLKSTLEIRTVEGIEGDRLAKQQARVLWEVMQWLAQNRSERG